MTLIDALKPLPKIKGEGFSKIEDATREADVAISDAAKAILIPLFNASPYLSEIAEKNLLWLTSSLSQDADHLSAELLASIADEGRGQTDETVFAKTLRQTKARMALLAAIAETGGVWTPEQSTAALADLADSALHACIDFLMRQAAEKGLLQPGVEASATTSGLAIFALGKQGGGELNYSSDIDIVAFYDVSENLLADPSEANKFYTRIIRNLVGLMDERTASGYVFRTDLRLRPDPGSTPVAISTDAAMSYYESRGQNWERAAWIKARCCAGDKKVGETFLKDLAPFVWRKHLDFATISDIQAMKRQINVSKNVGAARVAGHNVKLGRGGIREIEFFTQTQQLIAGGRDPDLRVKPTAKALRALSDAGWIDKKAADELIACYWYLRAVENRLQMLRDEQTQTMPESDEGIAVIAALMGEADLQNFKTRYRATLETVMTHYTGLFEQEVSLASDIGDLVFTGSDDDPGTLDTLQALGFSDAAKASATVRKWHYGGYAATRASASRAHLTELLPALLQTFSATGNADETMAKFDHFLSRFPAGIQLFALLRNHPELCRLLVAFMASAPRMAEAVIHRAHVMDGLIDPAFAEGVTSRDILLGKLDDFLGTAQSYEDLIDRARIIGQEQKFLISAGFLSGTATATLAGEQFTTLAETLLSRLFASARSQFAVRHGVIPGAEVALLGFGKLASREMTLRSDLDFILLYRLKDQTESNGEKPLDATQYFARLTQRLIAALSAPTAEGVLYEADMRLRPSGNAGPLATSLPGFIAYQTGQAWTWEHLALTRARVICGDEQLSMDCPMDIAKILENKRDNNKTIEDVVAMRELMAKERKPRHPFDLKLIPGGIVDIEFIAQSGLLVAYEKLKNTDGQIPKTLSEMGICGLLPQAERLVEIHGIYTAVLQTTSICLTDPFKAESWTPTFKELLAGRANYPTFALLETDIELMAKEVQSAAENWYERAKNL